MSTPTAVDQTPQSLRDMAQDWVDTLSLKRAPRVLKPVAKSEVAQ